MTCPRCDHLASEVMRLRQDRNEWRAVAVWFAGLAGPREDHDKPAGDHRRSIEPEAQPSIQIHS